MPRIPHVVAVVLLTGTLTAQTTLVAPSASFPTIQSAIAVAQNGDVVEVPPGTYVEALDLLGKAITLRSQAGPNATELRGPQRKLRAVGGESRAGTLVQGFRFTGLLGGNWSSIEVRNAGLTIRDCRFSSITVSLAALPSGMTAPAIDGLGADLLLEGCVFENCVAATAADSVATPLPAPGGDGGAIRILGGRLELRDCLLRGNHAGFGGNDFGGSFSFTGGTRGGRGGAIAATDADLLVKDCLFEDNHAGDGGGDFAPLPIIVAGQPGDGGAIHATATAAAPRLLEIVDSLFIANRAGSFGFGLGVSVGNGGVLAGSGGAIHAAGMTVRIEASFFFANEAQVGGAITQVEASSTTVTPTFQLLNSVLVDNVASGIGGGLFGRGLGDAEVQHCVFSGNGAGDGAAIRLDGGSPGGARVANSIFAASFGPDFGSLEGPNTSAVVFSFNLSDQVLPAGLGNLVGDPLFVSPSDLDFHLRPGSPAIDAGATLAGSPTGDWDDDPRPFGRAPDIGADEFRGLGLLAAGTVPDGAGGSADLIRVEGSAGGAARLVVLPVGSAPLWSIDAPPAATMPAHHLIWGRLGLPALDESYRIWFLGADMCFTPALVDPGNPLLFTFADSFDPLGSGLVSASPAPFAFRSPPIGLPVTITLQGLILDDQLRFGLTNAIAVEFR